MFKKGLIFTTVFFWFSALFANDSKALDSKQNNDTINQTYEGKKEGYWIIYGHMRSLPNYKPESIIEEGKFKTSRKSGLWKRYFSSGNKKSDIVYLNGKAIGTFTTYYDNRENTVEESGNWIGRTYTEKFVRYYENGNIAQEKYFGEKGKTQGLVKYYYPNGQIELEFSTKNGIETGTATRYWPNGDIKETIDFNSEGNGTSSGQIERVNPPVKLDENEVGSGVVADGKENPAQQKGQGIKDGYHKTYNENKAILMDGEFKNSKLWNGKHYIYDSYGLLERIEVYKKGKYIGNGVVE